MSLDINALFTPLKKEQIKATLYSTLQTMGFAVTNWRPGGIGRTLVALFAVVLAGFTVGMSKIARAGFLDWSEGVFLEVLAKQVYNVNKIHATFAGGFLTLTNSGGGIYPFLANRLTIKNAGTGKLYRNATDFTLGASTSITIPIQAVEIGTASNAATGEVTEFASPLIGVTATNADPITAIDEESDPALRERCRAKLGMLSPNGPKDAYNFVARTPELVNGHVITRTRVMDDADNGQFIMYIAAPAGAVDPDTVADVQAGVDQWATPQCVEPTVVSCTETTIDVTAIVYVFTSHNIEDAVVETTTTNSIDDYFEGFPIGGLRIPPAAGKVFLDGIATTIGSTLLDGIALRPFHATISSPSADTILAAGAIPKLGACNISTVHVVG